MINTRKQNLSISKEDFLNEFLEPNSLGEKPKKYLEPNPNGGAPKKYKEEYIELLYDVFNDFGGRQEFEGIVGISSSTFYQWERAHPKFKKAYERIKSLSYSQWEKLPLKEKDINIVYWTAIMRNRFNFGKPRISKANGKKPVEMIDAALESLEKGGMSIKDVNTLAEIATKRIELTKQVKELELNNRDTNIYDKLTHEDLIAMKSITDKYKNESK